MVPLSCIAIDDEPLALEKICGFIGRMESLKLEASFTSCLEAAPFLLTHQSSLVFLDIQMSNMTGIQMLKTLPYRPKVILTTAFSEYAIQGYEFDVIDYLLKPYSFERFSQAVFKAISRQPQPGEDSDLANYIFIKSDYKIVKVLVTDILYIEGMRDYRCLVTGKRKILTTLTFTQLSTLLATHLFARIHKSFMVNIAHIESIERHRIRIHGQLLPVSETYRDGFYAAIKYSG